MRHLALALLVVSTARVEAQTVPAEPARLDAVLVPGRTVWVTDTTGREERGRVASVSGGLLTLQRGEATQRMPTAQIVRVRARHFDSVVDGAVIGAAAAIVTGLVLCTRTEPWENCRDDVQPMVRIGAVGAAIGIGLDSLVRGRRTVYDAPRGADIRVAPVLTRRGGGVEVAVGF